MWYEVMTMINLIMIVLLMIYAWWLLFDKDDNYIIKFWCVIIFAQLIYNENKIRELIELSTNTIL